VLCHVDRERRLTHRRTASDDQQVARTQAAGLGVEIDEAGWQAC